MKHLLGHLGAQPGSELEERLLPVVQFQSLVEAAGVLFRRAAGGLKDDRKDLPLGP